MSHLHVSVTLRDVRREKGEVQWAGTRLARKTYHVCLRLKCLKGELGIRKVTFCLGKTNLANSANKARPNGGAQNEGAIAFMANNTMSVALKYSSMFQVSVGGRSNPWSLNYNGQCWVVLNEAVICSAVVQAYIITIKQYEPECLFNYYSDKRDERREAEIRLLMDKLSVFYNARGIIYSTHNAINMCYRNLNGSKFTFCHHLLLSQQNCQTQQN